MTTSETRYAKSSDVHIAYRTVGAGPLDPAYVPGWVSNAESMWDEPLYGRFLLGKRTAGNTV